MSNQRSTLEAIWQDDILDRKKDAERLVAFLCSTLERRRAAQKTSNYVLNIDANWGAGKTFFLKKLHAHLEHEGFLASYVNTWENDHGQDALLPVIDAIDNTVKESFPTKRRLRSYWESAKTSALEIAVLTATHGAKRSLKLLIDEGLDDIQDALLNSEENDSSQLEGKGAQSKTVEISTAFLDRIAQQNLEKYRASQTSLSNFKKHLENLLLSIPEKSKPHPPLFILVDELDRCRPSFAIETLERIKHLFDVNNVIFVVATDTSQLQHSIKAVYGSGFDSSRYLNRFFDRTYSFPKPDYEAFTRYKIEQLNIDTTEISTPENKTVESIVAGFSESYELDFRSLEKSLEILQAFQALWNFPTQIELLYLWPLISAHTMKNESHFLELKNGNPSKAMNPVRQTPLTTITAQDATIIGKLHHNSIAEYTKEICFLLRKNFDQIISTRSSDSPPVNYALDVLRAEYELIHKKQHRSLANVRSVILSYPDRVESAGFFSNID